MNLNSEIVLSINVTAYRVEIFSLPILLQQVYSLNKCSVQVVNSGSTLETKTDCNEAVYQASKLVLLTKVSLEA